jgi:hypothetical protein
MQQETQTPNPEDIRYADGNALDTMRSGLKNMIFDLQGVNSRSYRSRELSVALTNLEPGLLWLDKAIDDIDGHARGW